MSFFISTSGPVRLVECLAYSFARIGCRDEHATGTWMGLGKKLGDRNDKW